MASRSYFFLIFSFFSAFYAFFFFIFYFIEWENDSFFTFFGKEVFDSFLKFDLVEEEKKGPKYVTAATREIERWRPPRWISLFFIYFLSSSACGSFIIIGFQSLKQRSRIKEDELLFSSLLFSSLLRPLFSSTAVPMNGN